MEPNNERTRPVARLERIVVGVDSSEEAAGAVLAAAAQLPLSASSSILVVHVVRWGGRGYSPVAHTMLEQHGNARLAKAARVLTELLPTTRPKPGIDTALLFGEPFVELVRRAREERVDLLVVGRRGTKSFLDALMGSTAERVVRKGTTGVLVVGEQPRAPYVRPMLALDLSETCGRALDLALRVVAPEATIDVVHAWEPSDDAVSVAADVKAFLGRHEIPASRWNVLLRHGDPRAAILDEVRVRRSDLLVLGTHGRSALAQMLLGSVAETMVRTVPCDVIVARPAAHAFALP